MKNKKKLFNYVIIAAVLIIPFMYSFFYLKAYWNPYGKGNIDNLPIAIVNLDEGSRGDDLISSLRKKNTLEINVVSKKKADSGLNDQKYYAVITIPSDFSESIESASSKNKVHPTITYSSNQKANYLASQIIDKVMTVVESNLDNSINSSIVSTLSDNLGEVPTQLQTIVSGFEKLNDGTSKLVQGGSSLSNGTNTLTSSYDQFHNGLEKIKNGSDTFTTSFKKLNDGLNQFALEAEKLSLLKESAPVLVSSVSTLSTGSDNFTSSFNNYTDGVSTTLTYSKSAAMYIVNTLEQAYTPEQLATNQLYLASKKLLTTDDNGVDTFDKLINGGSELKTSNEKFNAGINKLNENTKSLSTLPDSIDNLQSSVNKIKSGSNQLYNGNLTINQGINTLFINSSSVKNGLVSLSNGTNTLNNGLLTLNSSVSTAKGEIIKKQSDTSSDVEVVKSLGDYSKNVVKVDKKVVNEVSSYGTAFGPFFISIALWVGALMMFIILYYDKQNRFKLLSIENENHLKRTLCYHGLATLSGIILAFLLQMLLDFSITSVPLYYLSVILVSNTFLAIIEFLIVRFGDVGKFIALILLVLQLAAAGGTFPIETVTKSFRFLNPILPMSYTIKLLRESLISIEGNLLSKNLLIVSLICLTFVVINVLFDVLYQKRKNK